jgi:hypothetical protein
MSDVSADTTAGLRHYPPGVVFHAPHCLEGRNRAAISIDAAVSTFPTREPHFCFGGMVPEGLLDTFGVAEIMPYAAG